ncbi:hypothetical protein NEUTE1DRAFT_116190 [Neurospora tetrasperma FGSC 2508]|uniref:Uncharacterized protein n=1 Tax=Neurospora tetrasperma (strain FGSC 2508 / ATCC MYA-4615 / P0657) TaxID=510951 RepID=F8MEQ8_NEUT8|nr:uncharacterized protein NEUTE1DRAFT_116190 [Neurospora tetrasperma FGSC 2508]EGO61687.1 hypothetical protein NEUTE1DRAFT_116190 [Neurospora tetrasperma FGSC 2508]EGZ74260.1 hypothetical protein NEUTE2DRAFT_143296 [Neurospora tetrasperma FGSC 2509]
MASLVEHERNKAGLHLETTTTRLEPKTSRDTLIPDGLSPMAEKNMTLSRPSDVSTPYSARANPFESDIEAMVTNETCVKKSTTTKGATTECQVWPGQDHWKQKAKDAKMNRHTCNCLAQMSKRNRIIVKVMIGLLVIGLAVGVGFGVSKPLGAGIWKSERQNQK